MAMTQEARANNTDPLSLLRNEIDEIDETIIALLEKRMRIAGRIGKVKQLQGIAVQDNSREKEILARIEERELDPKVSASIAAIYGEIFNQSRALQAEKPRKRSTRRKSRIEKIQL
jgi:monofunctional chorismate mutase